MAQAVIYEYDHKLGYSESLKQERVVVRGGIQVAPHVQAFANACMDVTGESNFGTYNGHDPDAQHALDCFVPVESDVLGNAICNFALEYLEYYGVDYVIYRQRIYNPEIATYWRDMADRGGVTQNHYDHVHISFEPTGHTDPPTPPPGDDFLSALTDDEQREIYHATRFAGQVLNEWKKVIEAGGDGNYAIGLDRIEAAMKMVKKTS